MKYLLPALLTLAVAVSAFGTAAAQQPGMVIAFLDQNADGKCDLNEYLTYQAGRMAEFDKDGDGEFILAEFKSSLQGKSKMNGNALFRGANSEGGRTLTRKEFLGYHAWVFNTFVDTDKDGFMSSDEWSAIIAKAS